ncbi:hypothetical protein [Actinomyces capricornis]|uniref:Uncharacterized protein n=1 Tax=Actinomyces capricornis TaxID=2755559 RepID=A0ABN6K5N1_9ACTO|nr:hypothetical protein [Actinomyces capricornis]BDA64868.1 hypothetical protein MANAM107_17020 [Actinomyces capricornis]
MFDQNDRLHRRVEALSVKVKYQQEALFSLTGWGCVVGMTGAFLTPWATGMEEGSKSVQVSSRNLHTFLFACQGTCERAETEQETLSGLSLEGLPGWVALLGLAMLLLAGSEFSLEARLPRRLGVPGLWIALLGLMMCLVQMFSGPEGFARDMGRPETLLIGPALPLLALAIACAAVRSNLRKSPVPYVRASHPPASPTWPRNSRPPIG